MKWYYLLGLVVVLLVAGILLFYWFEPEPEALQNLNKTVIDKDAGTQDKVTNVEIEVRDIDDTNLRDKNYDRDKIISKQKEWQERKPRMGGSPYTNEPTECAKKHNRSLC